MAFDNHEAKDMKNTITKLNQNEVKMISGGEWWKYALAMATPVITGAALIGICICLTKPIPRIVRTSTDTQTDLDFV
jgi:hypothetical protein